MSDQFIKHEEKFNGIKFDKRELVQSAISEEMTAVLNSFGMTDFNFSRPSHLRHFVGMDMNMYFMAIGIILNNETYPLFVYLSDILVEKKFAEHEFSINNPVYNESTYKLNRVDNELSKKSIIPELSFYYTLENEETNETDETDKKGKKNKKDKKDKKDPSYKDTSNNYPSESTHWKKLNRVLKRSSYLKIEETGSITIEDERFLYLTKPLYSMYTKSYQPCLLTSTKQIDRRIYDAGILLFALSSFAIIGSILLSFLLSSSLLVPIMKIDSAAQQIGKGNLDVVLPEETKDELGRLSMTFNAMVKGLRERARMKAYVSDSVLEAVKDNSDQSVHAGKNIEATILFSDIRNFTGISEANTPNRIFEVLNEFLGGVEPIIHANHGRVDKFIGDAVMAIFHHTEQEHHAKSAIKAAVKMKAFVAIMNEDRKKRGLFPIEIGIGISTGLVLLGDVGSRYRKDLTVIGDEVNLASRLETASKQGKHSKIIFSGQTLKFIEDFVEAEKMPFEEIRGKKNAVQIYEFIKFKDQNDIS
jgi:class 3 adenylate cyclase